MANVTNGSMASTAGTTDPVVIQLDQAAQLSRIADSLETIIDMIKKDQEESRKRWEEKDE
tara:strand:- start:285 stop:464 length:180 start_codon:yes stop_codon:yes gene_type:complete